MSILSEEADGCGFYYGFIDDDYRQINVRQEQGAWCGYVGGEAVATDSTKEGAEAKAIAWAKNHLTDKA